MNGLDLGFHGTGPTRGGENILNAGNPFRSFSWKVFCRCVRRDLWKGELQLLKSCEMATPRYLMCIIYCEDYNQGDRRPKYLPLPFMPTMRKGKIVFLNVLKLIV